ncbi:hypothetical protein N566_10535 [Streptomycetaceae bacterium MP113-05]|nr:hypothetical protein N566_10535 [Streptomycetaceae bacterium MP113-05]
MADDAYLFLMPDARPRRGAAVVAVGDLECLETPAVQGWLGAHGADAASEQVRILPAEAAESLPEDAETLPVPLGPEETERVRRSCAPQQTAHVEEELVAYRDTAQEWRGLVHRALDAGIPEHRIAQLTGLQPGAVADAAQR